jgi:hypothetical protein
VSRCGGAGIAYYPMIQDQQYNGDATFDSGPASSTQARAFFKGKSKGYQS